MSISLFNEDCILGIPKLTQSFDLVVTSPPYNAGKQYESKKSVGEYREFAKLWTSAVVAKMGENASLWLNVGYMKVGKNSTLPLTYLYYDIIKLPLVQEIVWHYEGGMPYKLRFSHRTERWMWFSKNPSKTTFNLNNIRERVCRTKDKRNNVLGKNPTDCWYFNRVSNNSKEKHGHPCQFPEAMIERIIQACSNPGDSILDPFMGSGTVGAIAKIHGMSFTGFEINPAYFHSASQRINRIVFTYFSD